MPHDSRNVPGSILKETLGSLGGCLVEGDPEQRSRERRVRRRSLIISILTQAAVVALLILLPLIGRTEHLALGFTTPVPPYSPYRGTTRAGGQQPRGQRQNVCHICAPTNIPPTIVTRNPHPTSGGIDDTVPDGLVPGIPGGGDLIPIPGVRSNMQPQPPERQVVRPSILHVTHLDPALLIYRVDPIYPPLAKQIHKEGRVELRAIIATDGTIQSLEIVGGDPMFYLSAKEAVSQWRYKPTVLNGQPMEIDTHITVIYSMPH